MIYGETPNPGSANFGPKISRTSEVWEFRQKLSVQ